MCMRVCTHGRHTTVRETSQTINFLAHFFYNTFLYWLANLLIDIAFFYWQVFFRWVKETNKITNLEARISVTITFPYCKFFCLWKISHKLMCLLEYALFLLH